MKYGLPNIENDNQLIHFLTHSLDDLMKKVGPEAFDRQHTLAIGFIKIVGDLRSHYYKSDDYEEIMEDAIDTLRKNIKDISNERKVH